MQKKSQILKVTVTGAAGNVGYALCFMIGQGYLLGPEQSLELCLVELPFMLEALKAIKMELEDSAFPLLDKITITTDEQVAFQNCDIALLIGAKPRSKNMQRKDLIEANAKIFKEQALLLSENANKNVKVVVVGNPANTNAYIIKHFGKNLKEENITALSRLDYNRALHQVAQKLQVSLKQVKNVVIWGNHSSKQFPDLQICQLEDGKIVKDILGKDWIEGEFVKLVQNRGKSVIEIRKKSSAASAASAICDHVRDWILGCGEKIVSMSVSSQNNSYGIPKDLIFSYPVKCKNGSWTIVEGLKLEKEYEREMIRKSVEELEEEKKIVLDFLSYYKNAAEDCYQNAEHENENKKNFQIAVWFVFEQQREIFFFVETTFLQSLIKMQNAIHQRTHIILLLFHLLIQLSQLCFWLFQFVQFFDLVLYFDFVIISISQIGQLQLIKILLIFAILFQCLIKLSGNLFVLFFVFFFNFQKFFFYNVFIVNK